MHPRYGLYGVVVILRMTARSDVYDVCGPPTQQSTVQWCAVPGNIDGKLCRPIFTRVGYVNVGCIVHTAQQLLFSLRSGLRLKGQSRYWVCVLYSTELTLDQWVMGQTGQQIWVGHVGHGSVPVTRWTILHCTHPVSHVIFWFMENQQLQS